MAEERIIGYRKTMQVKLVRCKHEVGFRQGSTRAIDLINSLRSVPPGALVDEILEPDSESDNTDVYVIVFHDEQKEGEASP